MDVGGHDSSIFTSSDGYQPLDARSVGTYFRAGNLGAFISSTIGEEIILAHAELGKINVQGHLIKLMDNDGRS
ncbi:hypothetical protein LguiA_005392 [Lonicera macranthoides]